MGMTVVKAEGLGGIINIVIYEGFDFIEGAVRKKDVGKIGFLDSGAFAIDQLSDCSLGIIGCALIINNVFVSLFLPAVCTSQGIPVRGAERTSCLLQLLWQRHTSCGHPCL